MSQQEFNGASQVQKNLILGLGQLMLEEMMPFLISLSKTSYKGDISLFVDDPSHAMVSVLRQYRVNVIPFRRRRVYDALPHRALFPVDQTYPYLVDLFGSFSEDKDSAKLWWAEVLHKSPARRRYFMYYHYLAARRGEYSNVMLTDVRDVLFQRDPFEFEFGDEICCFLEDKRKTIGSCRVNSKWIRGLFGPSVLREMADKRISCSGITIGGSERIVNYLEIMVKYLVRPGLSRQHYGGFGSDQGVHNYVVHHGLVPNLRLFPNESGPVLTMHHMREEDIRFSEDGFLVNREGSIVRVIHQYDRHPRARDELFRKLCT